MTEPEDFQPVSTAPGQVLRGEPIAAGGKALCTHCNGRAHEAETVLVHAYRGARDPEWLVSRLFCAECEGELIDIELPTIGEAAELLARARLMLTSGEGLNSYLALSAVEVLAQSRHSGDGEN